MKRTRRTFLIAALLLCGAAARGSASDAPVYSRSLAAALEAARGRSSELKAAAARADAARRQADAARSALYPSLSLEGERYYQTHVPSLDLPRAGSFSFGTHDNYAVGPALAYRLFDGGRDRKSAESAALLAKARDAAAEAEERALALSVRQAYFRAQYELKRVGLTADLFRLSSAQSRDIDLRLQEGSSSRLDQIQARRDMTANLLRFQQAQNELAAAFRDLRALLGETDGIDSSFPVPSALAGDLPDGLPAPTLRIALDELESTVEAYRPPAAALGTPEHPEVRVLQYQADSSRSAASSEAAGLWPVLTLQAREQYQHPDAVFPRSVWQGLYGATLHLPLFEGGASLRRADQRRSEARAYEHERDQRTTDLRKLAEKAEDALASLKQQRLAGHENVLQAREVERLTYDSYKSGESRYLDVQDANVRLLQAEVAEAQLESAILGQTALLDYLAAY